MRTASAVVLPFGPASVAVARGQFRAELRRAGIVAAPAADAALVMSELLSNAILHARQPPGGRRSSPAVRSADRRS